MDIIIQLITAFFGSLGYGLIFNVRRSHLLPASLNGMFTWGIYLAASGITGTILAPAMVAGAFTAFYAEVLARIRKAPANQFLIIGLMPLIPGRTLYYTMSYAVQENWTQSGQYGAQTASYALGIAAGISLVWAFWDMARKIGEIQGKK